MARKKLRLGDGSKLGSSAIAVLAVAADTVSDILAEAYRKPRLDQVAIFTTRLTALDVYLRTALNHIADGGGEQVP